MRLRFEKSRHVTVRGLWLKVDEAPEPISVRLSGFHVMRKGDTLNIEVSFDDLIEMFGTDDGSDDAK